MKIVIPKVGDMKTNWFIIITIFMMFICEFTFSQSNKLQSHYRQNLNVDSLILNNDYIIFLNEVKVYPAKTFNSKKEQREYEKLKRSFKKVYPYALEISQLYRQVEDSLAKFDSDKARKRYMKKREKEIMDYYKPKLVKLSLSQSILLVKLLDRESGSTAYEIIGELRGSVKAFFWQSFALLFGNSLKNEYDSIGKDKDIEELVMMYKEGALY
jgi:hypothetical protein